MRRFALGVAMVVGSVPYALAQESGSRGVEEVVVTARRFEESLQDVPASVSVLTADAIRDTGVENIEDIVALVPGVTIVTSTAEVGDTQINIRGINGARDAENNVALVVDGILKTNTAQLNQIQGTLEQVEILKGPQGAYYGRNAAAGAIVVRTLGPTDETQVRAMAAAGEYSTKQARGSVTGRFSENVGYAVSGYWRDTDGYYDNTGPTAATRGPTVDSMETLGIDGRIIWNVSDTVELDFKARYNDVDAVPLNYNAIFNLPTFEAALGNPDFNQSVAGHPFAYTNNFLGDNDQESSEFSVKADVELGELTWTSWMLYSDVSQEFIADDTSASFYRFELQPSCTATRNSLFNAGYVFPSPQLLLPAPFTAIYGPFGATTCDGIQYQIRDQSDWSFESRVSSNSPDALNWSAGVYYLSIDREAGVSILEDQGLGADANLYNPPSSISPTSLLFHDQFDTDVFAVFGSLDYAINDLWALSLALRYDREDRDVENLVPNVLDPATGTPINPGLPVAGPIPPKSETYDKWQPKVSLSYQPSEAVSIYGNWGVGFKAGGFNNQGSNAIVNNNFNIPLGATLLVNDEYREETSSAFEVGAKGRVGTFDYSVAAYATKVDDMQFFEFYTGGFGLLRVVTNIDEVDILGVELGTNWGVNDFVDLYASVNLTDSEIKENRSRPSTVGNESPYTADYTGNLGAAFNFPLNNGGALEARVDWRRTGPTWFHTVQDQTVRTVFDLVFPGLGTADYSKTEREAFNVVNLRIGYRASNWAIHLVANNVFDERIINEVIPAPEFGGAYLSPGMLRNIHAEFSVEF
jgi:iron complex outermembrane receptor protein